MPRHRKKFIDKNESVSWRLFPRAQSDIHYGDALAPQKVLVELPVSNAKPGRLDEQRKYGIYYEDDYDYMQHLRPRVDEDVEVVKEEGDRDDKETFSEHTEDFPYFRVSADLLPNDPIDLEVDDPHFFDPDINEALAAAEETADEELEDDFVNIANQSDDNSGRHFTESETKRDLLKRFFADNADIDFESDEDTVDRDDKQEMSIVSSRRGRPLTYHEEVIEEQFDRLVKEFQEDIDGEGDIDCADNSETSGMTKSNYQVLQKHEEDQLKEVITPSILDEGKLKGSETLRFLDAFSDSSDDDEDPVEAWCNADRREPLPYTCATFPRRSTCQANLPLCLDTTGGHYVPHSDDEDDSDTVTCSSDDESSTQNASESSQRNLHDIIQSVTDKKERKKLIKEYQRHRRQQKKELKQKFSKVKSDLSKETNSNLQHSRAMHLS